MEKEVSFNDLSHIQRIAADYSQIDDAYIFARLQPGFNRISSEVIIPRVKLDCLMLFVLIDGNVSIEYNFEKFQLPPNSAVSITPGVFTGLSSENWDGVDAYVLILSKDFLRDININLSAFNGPFIAERRSPVLEMDNKEMHLFTRYIELFHANAGDNFNPQLNKYIASSLTAALFYQALLILYKRMENFNPDQSGGRRNAYVHDFIKLVNVYYTKERSVSFYASKLFISPKYLSLLVKEATGRSAARWIDDFVIMEAKNLLRFSGKNIQQVAYALNFSNQSSFGKYFKHLTGLSPTEYQNS